MAAVIADLVMPLEAAAVPDAPGASDTPEQAGRPPRPASAPAAPEEPR